MISTEVKEGLNQVKDTSLRPAIKTEALSKYYGSTKGIVDLGLEVRQGEVFGYLGPNGSGKTTTIRLLMGLIRPTSGVSKIFDREVWAEGSDLRRRIGYVPGELALYQNMTGHQLLEFMGNLRGVGISAIASELAERLSIDLSRPIRGLSTGNRQKIGLIQAWMHKPDLLILDEPTTGLDPLVQQTVHELIIEARDQGRTVFLSSHVLSQVERVADRVGILKQGRLVAVESVDDLKSKALRRMEIHLASPVPAGAFSGVGGVKDVRVSGSIVRMSIEGSIDALIKTLGTFEVNSIVSHEPDLEEIFLDYYGRDQGVS